MRYLRWFIGVCVCMVVLAVGVPTAAVADPQQSSDPSGTVQDLNGEAVVGATVTLFRSDTAAGPFVQVPNGSPIMNPPNQNNPDTTGGGGSFGWSVTPGFYEVSAHAPACSTTDTETTGVIQAPPDNSNILITLNCIQSPQHGISFTKGCTSPTAIGSPYSCSYSVRNNVDEAKDTLTFTGLDDTVLSAGGPVSSGNVMTSLKFEIGAGSPTCNGIGSGTSADPFRNATQCTLPFGSRLNVQPFSFYTVQPGDFNLFGHALTDSATLTWQDLCNGTAANPQPGGGDCVPNPPTVGAASQSLIRQLPSTTSTAIHNAAHAVVTAVAAGATVHDFVTVSGGAGNPVPTGNVVVDWFTNNTCAGAADSSSALTPLGPAGTVDVTSFAKGPLAAGPFAFQARYLGDPANPVYAPSTGACEPLSVVDANIQISPAIATDPVGDNHVLTGHVNVNLGDGNGYVNAPAGTTISFTLTNAGGATATFVGPSSCTTVGATGSCSVTISSPTAGTTTIHATTAVTVSGVSLARATGDGLAGDSSDAQKTWVLPQGLIAPTATSCTDFTGGTAQALGQINYPVVGGNIGQGINPGVFFFYTKITTTTAGQVVTVTETNTSTNNTPNFGILNGQAWLYPAGCGSHSVGTVSGPNGENASYTVAVPGTYIIGIKYQTKTIAGAPAPVPPNITFNFETSLGGTTGGSVKLVKQ